MGPETEMSVVMNQTSVHPPSAHHSIPAEVTEHQYQTALDRAEAYLRAAAQLHTRARAAHEVATVRLLSSGRTLRIAFQVLERLRMLGRRFETN